MITKAIWYLLGFMLLVIIALAIASLLAIFLAKKIHRELKKHGIHAFPQEDLFLLAAVERIGFRFGFYRNFIVVGFLLFKWIRHKWFNDKKFIPSETTAALNPVAKPCYVERDFMPPELRDDAIDFEDAHPVCPDCKIPMVLRVKASGPQAGAKFWGCKNYPACSRTAPV